MMVATFWQPAVVCCNWLIYYVVCDMANRILSRARPVERPLFRYNRRPQIYYHS